MTVPAVTVESLVLRSADHPHAMIIAAGRLLAERLGITRGPRFMAIPGAKRMKF